VQRQKKRAYEKMDAVSRPSMQITSANPSHGFQGDASVHEGRATLSLIRN